MSYLCSGFQNNNNMTYTEIRIVLDKFQDIGRNWWVDDFISTKDKPNDILWIGGYNIWKKTIYAENSKGEEVEIYYDETPLCVTFLGAIRIDNVADLEYHWKNRIKIYDELKRFGKIMSISRPPFTSFVSC